MLNVEFMHINMYELHIVYICIYMYIDIYRERGRERDS